MRAASVLAAGVLLALVPAATASAKRFGFTHTHTVYTDGKGRALVAPEGVSCSPAGDVFVADTGRGRLLRFNYRDGRLTGGDEIKLPDRVAPVRVQADSKGGLVVLDRRTRRLLRVGADGRGAAFVAFTGSAAAAKAQAAGFKLDAADNVYLLDIPTSSVIVADAAGAVRRTIPLPADVGVFADIAVTTGGTIYALTGASARIFVAKKGAASFTPLTKGLSQYLSYGAYLTTDRREQRLLVVDQHGNGIVVVGLDGSYQGRELSRGWRAGFVHFPTQICLHQKGELFVADRNNHRVQVFSSAE